MLGLAIDNGSPSYLAQISSALANYKTVALESQQTRTPLGLWTYTSVTGREKQRGHDGYRPSPNDYIKKDSHSRGLDTGCS